MGGVSESISDLLDGGSGNVSIKTLAALLRFAQNFDSPRNLAGYEAWNCG